jgi:hypothetical protein
MDKSGAGAGFLRELRFPLPIYIPSASPQSSSLSPEAGTIRQECRSAYSLTNQTTKKLSALGAGRTLTPFFFKIPGTHFC